MDTKTGADLLSDDLPAAGPSAIPDAPPSFQDSIAAPAPNYNSVFAGDDIFIPYGGEEPPPEFTPYEAEYFVDGNGDIVSHDPHLNQDGEALYRFLLSHSQMLPDFRVHLRGWHSETRTRQVTRTENGRTKTMDEEYTEVVIDFDFSIDVGQHIVAGPIHWSLPDDEPAYRGNMYKEIELYDQDNIEENSNARVLRRKATKVERKLSEDRKKEQNTRGLPPWVASTATGVDHIATDQVEVLKSSKTLRQWADEYCASNKLLKEFTYKKVVYGWHRGHLKTHIEELIKSTYYSGTYEVDFRTTNAKIFVRSDNRLSRILSNKWLKFLLILLLIYPFIWLYKHFSRRGGGRWEVCGGAYALKKWHPINLKADQRTDSPLPPHLQHNSHLYDQEIYDMPGTSKLIGMREGTWYEEWESTIKRAVTGRLQSTVPLKQPDERPSLADQLLEGFGAASAFTDHVPRLLSSIVN
ncbi:hypothetical protein WOLCODRAFT_135258 [Wolfiporia cocos MD-104 SS10]|uniref:Uncharacterized protein n=1 Tax=Wolfiporia cocos (strain MD-104) TaxID=742152 RepID=A0A2H3J4K7_WOLCO|nr:hypothetical protein WOLCODRAFT_135258 [Wolfiporia cocos MD-104 SS10]